ncbi:D-alanine--D-alanine ligase family protein [Thermoflexus sp.]|uniref:D-alanine--D-alanine ligase family protein n=1 Tax=Thermoflexus sp. TaxID=1969742 RepID=UPI0035E411EB
MKRRIRVGVLFGGKSGEHEVSLLSAQSVIRALDKTKYEVIPIGITKEGRWLTRGDPMKALTGGAVTMADLLGTPSIVEPESIISPPVPRRRELIPGVQAEGIPEVDVIFPVLHGPFGEDGTIQGLLELAGIPYVGAGVLASAVGMDKAVMKDVFRAHGLPVAWYIVIFRREWERDPEGVMDRIEQELGFPCFVKPANLGSSVGVSKVKRREELPAALAEAARYGRKMLVERAIPAAREIEVSVLGNEDPIASVPGEVIPAGEFYDYAAKYLDDRTQLVIPAPLDEALAERIRSLALKAFRAIDAWGMARVDFLLSRETGELVVNEINTIPGFTAVSMYPRLWEASGLPYPALLDRLIELALERYRDRQRDVIAYEGWTWLSSRRASGAPQEGEGGPSAR